MADERVEGKQLLARRVSSLGVVTLTIAGGLLILLPLGAASLAIIGIATGRVPTFEIGRSETIAGILLLLARGLLPGVVVVLLALLMRSRNRGAAVAGAVIGLIIGLLILGYLAFGFLTDGTTALSLLSLILCPLTPLLLFAGATSLWSISLGGKASAES